jgi:phosphoserine aminotransferase
LPAQGVASYADTGQWAGRAIDEAANYGRVHMACSSREDGYLHIPDSLNVLPESVYFHLTTNNTVYGTRWLNIPQLQIPLIADMSSDILSAERDYTRFDLIYASAQKNIGPPGVTLVAIRRQAFEKADRPIPAILDYDAHIRAQSLYHTPDVWAVAGCLLCLRWIKQQSVARLAAANARKAAMLYDQLDRSEIFYCPVTTRDRSMMNVRFHARKPEWEAAFLQLAESEGLRGLKGYRTVGGFRASIYNAMPESGVQRLTELLADFESRL